MTEGAPQQLTDIDGNIKKAIDSTEPINKQDSNPKPKENIWGKIKRTCAAGAAAVTIAAGAGSLAGCDQIPTAITEVKPSETEPSVTINPTENTVKVDPVGTTETTKAPTSVETTAAPTETTAPTETDVNAELAEAPEISGLSKEIENGKVVYKAVEGNEYKYIDLNGNEQKIEVGEFCGEYKKVLINGEETGTVSFIPAVAEKLLNDELAKIPEGERRIKIIPPIDLTQVGEDGINISEEKDYYGNLMLKFSSDNNLDVRNNIPNGNIFSLYWFEWKGVEYGVTLYMGEIGDINNISNEDMMYFVETYIPESDYLNRDTENLSVLFGDKIGESQGEDVYIGCSDSKGSYSVEKSDLAYVDNCLMSITSEE